MHIDVRSYYIYIHIYICTRRSSLLLTYHRWRFSILIYNARERKGEDAEKRYITSSPPSLLFPWSIDSQKMPVTLAVLYVCLFPSTVPFPSLLPLLFLRYLFLYPIYISCFFWISLSLSLSLPPFLFLVRSTRESRLACRLRSTRNAIRKERIVGELPHRSSRERKECRDVGVRGRNT